MLTKAEKIHKAQINASREEPTGNSVDRYPSFISSYLDHPKPEITASYNYPIEKECAEIQSPSPSLKLGGPVRCR